jgi:uncharacterized protein (DUF1778 family)
MAKTITVRMDDETYRKIKTAADAERRTISNFIENAALSYVESSGFVSDEEMEAITGNSELIDSLKKSLNDIKEGKYNIVD